jgi:hypothetical protein
MIYDIELLDYCSKHIHASDPREISRRSMGGFGYHGDTPIGDTWAIMYSYAPNVSNLLEDSNWEVISEDMIERFSDDTTIERFSSWFTPTENLMIRMINECGLPTAAAVAIKGWLDKLNLYPVADEDHWSNKEYESEGDCIYQELRYLSIDNLDENVSKVWSWLGDNNKYSEDGYFDSSDIRDACESLGLLEESDND